jgi:hypothetical protein
MSEVLGLNKRSYFQECLFVFPAFIIIATLSMFQAPLLALVAHDDWEFILGGAHLREKLLLNEGRPLTYLWSIVSTQILAPEFAILICWLSMSHISHSFARLLGLRSIPDQIFCAAVVLLSAPVLTLSSWSSSHAAGLVTTALGAYVLSDAQRKAFLYQLSLVAVFAIVTFLFYPAFAFIIFAAGMCLFRNKNEYTKWGALICAFLASIATALVVILVTNKLLFQSFTVRPASWRSPIYGTQFFLVIRNISNLGEIYFFFLKENLIWLFLLASGWIYLALHCGRRLLHALVVILIPVGFDLLLVGATGLMPTDRHFLFFPLSVIVAASALLEKLNTSVKAILIVIIFGAGIASIKDYTMSKVACGLTFESIRRKALLDSLPDIKFVGPYTPDKGVVRAWLAYAGYRAHWCKPDECVESRKRPGEIFFSPTEKMMFVNISSKCSG